MFRSKPKKSGNSGGGAANVPGGMDFLNFGNLDEASLGQMDAGKFDDNLRKQD